MISSCRSVTTQYRLMIEIYKNDTPDNNFLVERIINVSE